MDPKYVPLCYQSLKYTLGPRCPQTFAVMVVMVVMVVIVVQTLNTGSDSERFALFWMESEFVDGQNHSGWHWFGTAAAEATQLSLPGDGESEPRPKVSANFFNI